MHAALDLSLQCSKISYGVTILIFKITSRFDFCTFDLNMLFIEIYVCVCMHVSMYIPLTMLGPDSLPLRHSHQRQTEMVEMT